MKQLTFYHEKDSLYNLRQKKSLGVIHPKNTFVPKGPSHHIPVAKDIEANFHQYNLKYLYNLVIIFQV